MNLGGTIRVNKFGLIFIIWALFIFTYYMMPTSPPDEPKVNLRSILLAALEAAELGGKEIIKVSKDLDLGTKTKGETKDGYNMPVTSADYNSHCVMYYGLSKLFPHVKVISEEHVNEKKCEGVPLLELAPTHSELPDEEVLASDVAIWIDPLDATHEYTEKLYQFVTTMACVSYQGKPIIGVIHKPFGDEPRTSWAWLHKANSPNLNVLLENTKESTKNVLVSMSHPGKVKDYIEPIFGKNVNLVAAAGSGYKTLEVVVSNATAYLHTGQISKWDICAGDAILTATGGHFSSLDGSDIDYSPSSQHLHESGLLAARSQFGEYIANAKKLHLKR